MNRRDALRRCLRFYGLLVCLLAPRRSWAEPSPEATAAFEQYVGQVEARLVQQRSNGAAIRAAASRAGAEDRLRAGELILEQISPTGGKPLQGATLQHWRGTAFAPGATAAQFERMLRDVNAYPRTFAPEVLKAGEAGTGDSIQTWMRVRQKHVLTVVMDSSYDVTFGHTAPSAGFSWSRSTHVYEIGSPGTPEEHRLTNAQEHGFLWRLNTYWSWEQEPAGLWIQVETVSLSRSIPTGLGWAVRPFIESVPRESLEFTLRSAKAAVTK